MSGELWKVTKEERSVIPQDQENRDPSQSIDRWQVGTRAMFEEWRRVWATGLRVLHLAPNPSGKQTCAQIYGPTRGCSDRDGRLLARVRRLLLMPYFPMTQIASDLLTTCLAVKLKLPGKDQEFVSSLAAVFLPRHTLPTVFLESLTSLPLCSLDLRLQPSLLNNSQTPQPLFQTF